MPKGLVYIGGTLLILLFAGIGAFSYYSLTKELASARSLLESARSDADAAAASSSAALARIAEENSSLSIELRREQEKNGTFTSQLSELSGTVGALQKLATIDPQLLTKYSKVYFLNENYSPAKLARISADFAFQPDRVYEIHGDVAPFLEDLLEESREEGLSLKIASAYRSFASQASLKSSYTVRYGSGANAFSADQGYSEHQLATTVDLTTPSVGGTFAGFDKTKEYEWLQENAWKHGFVLSYPKGNAYYQYEPWHWRFVGTELAERLHEDEEWFYDLDQRTIDGYLGGLFD